LNSAYEVLCMLNHRRLARPLIALCAAAIVLVGLPPLLNAKVDNPEPTPLRRAAIQHGKKFGTAVDVNALATEPAYAAMVARDFSTITPENVMKWDTIEPTRGVFNFGPADGLVQFASEHNEQVHGHTLVWHNQLPPWLTSGVANGTISSAELSDILHQHIIDEVTHFGDFVDAWDVVNEPLNEDGTLRQTIWLQAMGPSYIDQAFIWARQANPKAKLYINEFNLDFTGAKSNAMFTLVQGLLSRSVPIDGVGFQGHLALQFGFPDLENNLRRFANLGLEVSVTEADVRIILPTTPALLAQQATYYQNITQACLNVKRCFAVTVWGFTDRHSWVPGVFTGQGAADLLDEALLPKPAYTAVLQTLSSR
jgi:endo-1,4-beta-xylanase